MKQPSNRNNHSGCKLLRRWIFPALIFILTLYSKDVRATHAAGSDLTYRCLGGLVYEIEATFYRDCGGSAEPSSVTITYNSASANYTRNVIASKVVAGNGMEITLPCVSAPTNCTTGMNTGIKRWVYRVTVTLPSARADWVFSYRVCCRNCSITTIQSPCAVNSEIYVEAKLNNIAAPGNSSPVFNNIPLAFVCVGQKFNYNQGVSDIDGDSVSYELIDPKTSANTQVSWIPPASTQTPIASSTPFTINSITGDIKFKPSSLQIGILAVRVNEFRNGQLIGSTIRDIQMYTQFCANNIPVASGMNGTNDYDTIACVGQQICFLIYAEDAENSQGIVFSNFNPIAGSTLTEIPGGQKTLQFCWTPTAADFSTLPHTFTVTVRDNACPANGVQTFSYSIYVNDVGVTATSTNPSCATSFNGTASAVATGIPPFAYSWNTNPVQHTASATGLGAGNYSVTVTAPGGCSATTNVSITNPVNSVIADVTSNGIITCQSGNIASVQATATSGTTPYTYLWNTGHTTASVQQLGPGTYRVTVTDAGGCTSSDSVTIAPPSGSVVVQAISQTQVNCFGGNNGTINVNANGGASPYTYSWSNGASGAQVNGLTAGNYVVTATDANGCTAIGTYTINQPPSVLSLSGTTTQVKCYGTSTGAVDIQVNGGITPYSYAWSNGISTQDINNLAAGNYNVTITDANGCTAQQSYVITQPSNPVVVTATQQNVSCYGSSNGNISIAANGGVQPYSYLWNTGASGNSLANISQGNYNVTVTDANLCTAILNISVTQPAAPLTAISQVTSNILCYGGSNGQISLTVNGGTAPYTYLWSNGNTNKDQSALVAGNYNCTITDSQGCTTTSSMTITQPAQSLSASLTGTDVSCYNIPSGNIITSTNGGTSPYSYNWSNSATTASISALPAGNYTVTITDANNCSYSASHTIQQPVSAITVSTSQIQNVSCFGSNNGLLSVVASGGTVPYTYLWNNGNNTASASGLVAGTYSIVVTDGNGCSASIVQLITAPVSAVTATATVLQNISCYNGSNGSLTAAPSGGATPFTYEWNTGAVTQTITGLNQGAYSVTITDANGCTVTVSSTLTAPGALLLNPVITPGNCITGQGGSIQVNVTGGTSGYTYLWNDGSTQNTINVQPGNYSITVTDANNCSVTSNYVVETGGSLDVQVNGAKTICTGEIAHLETDSVPGAEYQWYYEGDILNGATSREFYTPAAGFYAVSVTTSCGTFRSDSVEVQVKTISNVSVSNTQIICPPETAQLNAYGGVTYEWNPPTYITFTNVPDPVVSPLQTTKYSVLISNEFGCKTTLTAEVAVVCDSLLVPTGFSPNDDGTNDGYVIDGIENYPGNKLWIYNRWGKLVYKATDYNNSWNGMGNISGISAGKKVPSGTYYFILDLNDHSKPRAGYLIIRGG